jgi:hypothetical protein
MVNVTFTARARHFVPLTFLRHIADPAVSSLPSPLSYLTEADIKAIKGVWLSFPLALFDP